MGLSSSEPFHARHRHGAHRADDRRKAAVERDHRRGWPLAGLTLALALLAPPAIGESLRVATYNAGLSRDGPGLLLRDILSGKDAQAAAVAEVVAKARPDVILLTGIDYDADLAAASALVAGIAAAGLDLPHRFAYRPNTGRATGLDLDGDGRLGGPRDAQGYGRFAGEGGMVILSRFPLDVAAAQDFSGFLWADLPGGMAAEAGLVPEALVGQRLSTTGHWDVPVVLPGGTRLRLLAYAATPPVFDGPEDRNGRRNHDETAFWLRYLEGGLPWSPPAEMFVVIGDANLDPDDGDGRPAALARLLSHPHLTDPEPASAGAAAAEAGGATDTADWAALSGVGRNLRVDYVLPSRDLRVEGAGVWWPEPGSDDATVAAAASRHRLVWVDVALP